MRKFAALGLLLTAALFVTVSMAEAGNGNPAPSSELFVQYEGAGHEGVLTIVAHPGSSYRVFDSTGQPVAAGQLASRHGSFSVPNSGPGSNGVILVVRVNDDVVAVTDPDWEWN